MNKTGKKTVFFFLLLLAVFPLAGGEKLLLWEAVHPEKPGKFFLAGSIHLGKKELYPLDKAFDLALEKSDEIIYEIYEKDIASMQKMTIDFIRKKAFYPPGKSLRQVMGEKEILLLDTFYKSRGNMYFLPNGVTKRPWILALALAQNAAIESGLDAKYGFEEVFKKHLKNRKARGLEKVYTQLSTLEGTPEKEMTAMIVNGLKNPSRQKKELENIIRCFESGRIDLLIRQTEEMQKKYPVFHKRLLLDRNKNMTAKLWEFSNEKKRFFVLIGAAHFAGKGNILQLLAEKGFIIKQADKTRIKGNILAGEE